MRHDTLPKKLLTLSILEILQKYSDEDHRLSQKQIEEILQQEYSMTVNRKAVKDNLMYLIEFGYDLGYETATRSGRNGEEEEIYYDWYLKRDITDAELRYIIDGLLTNRNIPYQQCKELIAKLSALSSQYFQKPNLPQWDSQNKQLFYTIEILEQAIRENRQVSFAYCDYGIDKELHYRRRSDGSIREYIINPYRMALKDGKYYLICNLDKYDDIANYRIDRIKDIKLLDTKVKPFDQLAGANRRMLDFPKYMSEHLYMYYNDTVQVKFRASKALVGVIIDTFGKDITIMEESESHVIVLAKVNEAAMGQFARSFLYDITVLSPQSLVDDMKADIQTAFGNYGI